MAKTAATARAIADFRMTFSNLVFFLGGSFFPSHGQLCPHADNILIKHVPCQIQSARYKLREGNDL